MVLLNIWVLFAFIPLFMMYRKLQNSRQSNLIYITLVLLIIAVARPVLKNSFSDEKFNSQNYIIAIDASYSMQADDLKPTRYEVAKQNIKDILEHLPQNRFSIFAFTSNAMLISPPTTDTAISLMALNSLEPKYILTKGTSLLSLIKTVSKISYKKKNLLIFSDGGEDYDLDSLVNISKTNTIIPYIIATGSSDGAVLKKNNINLKDEKNNLVVSRINPILKDFATLGGGHYYELDSSTKDISAEIISDMLDLKKQNEKLDIQVLSYSELFYIPLVLAIVSFFLAFTKLHQSYFLIPLLFLPHRVDAYLLDFYHLESAKQAYTQQDFLKSAKEFDKLTPSVKSYYNRGVSYYKAGHYKKAIEIFSIIKSTNIAIKQKLFYNMGNCAIKLKKYKRAKIYYQKALAFGFDKDSYYNLTLLYKLNLKQKKNVSNMLPKNKSDKQAQASKKNNTKKDENRSGNSNSNQKAGESSNGSSKDRQNKKEATLKKNNSSNKSEYKIGYKAYELINKGYTNEKHPW